MLPTHAQITDTLLAHIPTLSTDLPLHYHTPRHSPYRPSTAPASHIVLSITPTPGFYALVNSPHVQCPPLAFLHRPWTLERRRVRRGVVVLASHTGFDAALTVGWNTGLAGRLGVEGKGAVCVQGYKGDAERRIGLVGRVEGEGVALDEMVGRVQREFGGVGEFVEGAGAEGGYVLVVAIMNAFHGDEVARVLEAARERRWVEDGSKVLYLTGQARESGMYAAREAGMPVLCVGHRACEEWGIRFLAERLREQYPTLKVQEIYEEEEPRSKEEKKD